jgi:hypothetical protein
MSVEDKQLAAYQRIMGVTPAVVESAPVDSGKPLNEQASPGGLPKPADPIDPAAQPGAISEDEEIEFNSVQEAVDALAKEIEETYANDPILSKDVYTEHTVTRLKAVLTKMFESTLTEGKKGVTKGTTRTIRKRVGGRYVKIRQDLADIMDRVKAGRKRHRNASKIARAQKKYARSAKGRKAKRFYQAHVKESTASQLKAMLESEQTIVPGNPTELHLGLQECYDRIETLAGSLRWFFENHGAARDQEMVGVLVKLQESATNRSMLMESDANKPEIGSLINQLRVLQGTLKVFDEYRFLQPAVLGN